MIELLESLRNIVLIIIALVVGEFVLRTLGKIFGLYTIVQERQAKVYVLFGKVLSVIDEPGLHILPTTLGPAAFIVNIFGNVYTLDLRLDQQYLRSQPVNSEEGAPMGIGIWYEMWISDAVAFLFKNTDPRGSLQANVSSSAVRCLSNMPLAEMLETRHQMSQAVRNEVSLKSHEWGYKTGSVYIRKVHFRDAGMIHQIEAKVVNRLRQVTSAIKQAGANQVSVITSSAERAAAVEFARAAAIRPATLRQVLTEINVTPEVRDALFEVLETQRILASNARLSLLAAGEYNGALTALLAGRPATSPPTQ